MRPIEGARLRFRPVMMTSFAFILGLLPLVIAVGRRRGQPARGRHAGVRRHARGVDASASSSSRCSTWCSSRCASGSLGPPQVDRPRKHHPATRLPPRAKACRSYAMLMFHRCRIVIRQCTLISGVDDVCAEAIDHRHAAPSDVPDSGAGGDRAAASLWRSPLLWRRRGAGEGRRCRSWACHHLWPAMSISCSAISGAVTRRSSPIRPAPSWANWLSWRAGPPWSMPTPRSAVEALIIPPDRLRALLVAEAELGERIMRALILRRVGLLETGAGGPVIVGRAENGDVLRLEGFLARNGHPHQRLDPETDPARKGSDRTLPHRPGRIADRAVSQRTAAAQSERGRARPLHRAGRADRSEPGL